MCFGVKLFLEYVEFEFYLRIDLWDSATCACESITFCTWEVIGLFYKCDEVSLSFIS